MRPLSVPSENENEANPGESRLFKLWSGGQQEHGEESPSVPLYNKTWTSPPVSSHEFQPRSWTGDERDPAPSNAWKSPPLGILTKHEGESASQAVPDSVDTVDARLQRLALREEPAYLPVPNPYQTYQPYWGDSAWTPSYPAAYPSSGEQLRDKSAPLCRFFAQGHCTRGDTCSFSHVTDTKPKPARKPKYASKKADADEFAASSMDPAVLDKMTSVTGIVGQVYVLAKDQHGCRLLQRFLEMEAAALDIIYAEVVGHITELMTDPFGNYLCQKLIECCTAPQRQSVVQQVAPELVSISLNVHGTRVVQKMVEVAQTGIEVDTLSAALCRDVVTLTKDLNGNHVIQRCLLHMPSSANQFIYDAIAKQCVSVATHKHGCCVLQRCIDFASESQRGQLIDVIVQSVLELVQDAFGNYVVQYILDLGDRQVCRCVMEQMLGNIANLAVQKFSSNVVEKCLQIADQDLQEKIIQELCHPDRLCRLLQDPYANYVIQKALAVSKGDKFEQLVQLLRPFVAQLRATSFGKRIQAKIVKKFPVLASEEPESP